MKLAAIDIGSNSIKLVVVDAAASDSFVVLAREKEVVRLGHETLLKGYLGRAAILRAASCINRFRSIAEARGAERIVTIATASVREANNAANFIKAIAQKSGLTVEVLSGIEEARLIGLAAYYACGNKRSSLLNIDIGGGSTELSVFRNGAPKNLLSLKLGAVGLSERFIRADPPKAKELESLYNEIRLAFQRPARELRAARWGVVTGTSGTIQALGIALAFKSRKHLDVAPQTLDPQQTIITFKKLCRLNESLAEMSANERSVRTGITPQRAEIIVSGGLILEEAMRSLRIKSLQTCNWALREGVIIDRLREWEEQSLPPMPDLAEPKLRGVHAVGKRFGYEENHAHQVSYLAERIYDALSPVSGFSRHERVLLSAAALLHDVGYHIAHDSHHKHSHYLIEHSELTGFSESERVIIANTARYHRGSGPKDRHPNFALLGSEDQETVRKLSSILRIADALDRRHDSRIVDLKVRRTGKTFNIKVLSSKECEDEVTEANRRLDLFKSAFKCRINFGWERTTRRPTRRRLAKKAS